ncbi:phospholipase D-like domain-containing protein [Novosphingobium rosa]|uniref:phospholipase D-like domain-containing protein n=1 Tax=Novosphingobium rosa TaxID=76978 RepID=UPI0008353113|nr:phospholipase D-like domain-containing protein [Novosphingobium rosa]
MANIETNVIETRVGDFSLKAYAGDFKTLLAFNFTAQQAAQGLAGFTIRYSTPDGKSHYLWNSLVYEHPENHAQVDGEPPQSTANAPIHKFRWVHVPGVIHQGDTPMAGNYLYEVTPRFFDENQHMLPLDHARTARVDVQVGPFRKGNLALGFTRGFVQSEAFVHRFGKDALLRPAGHELIFDTSAQAGTGPLDGEPYSFAQAYQWLGFTARDLVFDLLQAVETTEGLTLDVFAYDLTEPDFINALVRLAAKPGKLRIILDNAALHHAADGSKPEDQAEALIARAAGDAQVIKRGHFARYAHDKVLVVSDASGPLKVLTGSTNFSVNGLYVNSNHVLVYDDREVAGWYKGVFDASWDQDVKAAAFIASNWSTGTFTTSASETPKSVIRFSPHTQDTAQAILDDLVTRVNAEKDAPAGQASVLFAVMALNEAKDVVYQCLNALHAVPGIFSYGISDAPEGVTLYPLGQDHGVLVTGKPGTTDLPAPFDQVPPIREHQVHHKFVVCGFNRPDAVVYCGSSNLAEGGEHQNGDNLIAIADTDIATAFAIEALALVDHFDFLDAYSKNAKASGTDAPAGPAKAAAAQAVHWYLGTTDLWMHKYFQPGDLHNLDRELFGAEVAPAHA